MTPKTYDAILVHNRTIKVDNRTDYYIDQWLYTDPGIINVYYRKQRGMEEVYWNEILNDYKFGEPMPNAHRQAGLFRSETSERSLDFHDFLMRTFYMSWSFGSKVYGMLYDHPHSTIICSDTETYWDII